MLLRRKFLSLFPSFFPINLFYRFKIRQIAKNLNLTCVRGLEISFQKVRKYRPPLHGSQNNSPRDLRKAVLRLTTWVMHCDVKHQPKDLHREEFVSLDRSVNIMSSQCESSSSSSSGSDTEEVYNMEEDLSNFVPYEEDLEPLATEEEAAVQDARMAEELEEELRYQARFDREVDVNPGGGTWVFFGWVCAPRDSKLAPRSKNKFP